MSKTLEQHLERLAETLEDNPDPWYNDPKGYLKKPSYGRPAQEKAAILKKTTFTNILGSGYQKRFFVLDIKNHKMTYYGDESKSSEKGFIDLNQIIDIQYSAVFDAPEFSLDLVASNKHYTIVADSHAAMLRWAFALNLAIPQSKLSEEINLDVVFDDTSKSGTKNVAVQSRWFEYQVVYEEEGPLMLNVVGMVNRDKDGKFLNNLVCVTSFDNYPDGTPGVSEMTGMISVKDYIIGVNNVDLTKFTFNEALGQISKAVWPKTLHFIRDNLATRDVARIEGWAVVFYPTLNRRRRRYIELVHDTINFKKVEPGGSASNARDAYFKINQIRCIRPVVDKTVPQEQQFTLQLLCYPESLINHVDEDDISQGGTYVETLELCFSKLRQLNQWRSALVSPLNLTDGTILTIQALNLETIEDVDVNQTTMATKIAIKIEVTGFFAPREFTLSEGSLKWRRISESGGKDFKGKGRSLFIGNATNCALKVLRMIRDPKKDISGYEYQLLIETNERVVVMGMKDELALTQWYNAIRDTAMLSPSECRTKLSLSTSIEVVHLTNTPTSIFTEEDRGTISGGVSKTLGSLNQMTKSRETPPSTSMTFNDNSNMYQGFLYLKQEKSALGLITEGFKRRWFILHNFDFTYYKSDKDSFKYPLGSIDLKEVFAVRESCEESSPENSIEIITANRVFLLVAEDEEEQIKWLDILADKLEERRVAAQREDGFLAAMGLPKPQKMEAMKRIVQFCGRLHKKNGKIWKERYFVLANKALTYYETEDEFYDDYKDCLGTIMLSNIVQVCSSNIDKCKTTGFEVHAYATKGERDAKGIRIFTFNAHIESLCKEWMTAICEATGKLELRNTKGPTEAAKYASFPIESTYSSSSRIKGDAGNSDSGVTSVHVKAALTSSPVAKGKGQNSIDDHDENDLLKRGLPPPPQRSQPPINSYKEYDSDSSDKGL